MASTGRTIVVMPAYNAVSTLRQTLADLPGDCVDEVILVDDCSKDGTASLARELGLTVFEHERNLGYGGIRRPATAKPWPAMPTTS